MPACHFWSGKHRRHAMSSTPDHYQYTEAHTWIHVDDDDVATVGITDFAQSELGDVVFVELPEVGAEVTAGDEISVVESVKTASDIPAPVSGEVVAVNDQLGETPELINSSPYDKGWIFRIRISNSSELEDLLNASEYTEFSTE
jgi:glycine cleavage system H protein